MSSSWKPALEVLEARENPAVMSLIGFATQVVYPPTDPTSPPPPPPLPGDGGVIVIVAPTPPWLPGAS